MQTSANEITGTADPLPLPVSTSAAETEPVSAASASAASASAASVNASVSASNAVGGAPSAASLPGSETPTPLSTARLAATRGWLAAGLTAQLNLICDLIMLVIVLGLGRRLSGGGAELGFADLAASAMVGISVWVVTATAVHHYEGGAYARPVFDDAAMTTVVLVAVFTGLVVFNTVFRAFGGTPIDLRLLIVDLGIAVSLRIVFRRLSRNELPSEDVIVIGAGIRGRLTAEAIEKRGREAVMGLIPFDGEAPINTPHSLPVLGAAESLEPVLRNTPVSRVYIAGNALREGPAMQKAISLCEQLGVPFALPVYPFRLDRARPVTTAGVQDGYLHYHVYEPKLRQRAIKRLFDIVTSAIALWLLSPLFLVVAMVVKLTSRGPAFFKQERVGLRGEKFNMLKFRSMVTNAEELKASLARLNEQTGPVFKMRNDPRVTKIGRFIRKYSIDELPQLINVLRGDMSIVGPRPPVLAEVQKYEAWQLRRLCVRPGLTCLWQVSGRNQISFEDWMYLDMNYIDHWSLRQDLELIFRTVPVVIFGRGAS